MRQLLAWTLLFFCGVAAAQEVRLPVRVVRIYDGDTVTVDVQMPWGVTLTGESVRDLSYDAWEIRRGRGGVIITEEELAKGRQAAKDLEALFATGRVFVGTDVNAKRDSFGRLLGKYWVYREGSWVDVRSYMALQGNLRHDPLPATVPRSRGNWRR